MRNAFLIPAFFCLTLFLNCGPSYDLSKFENLREPKISEKASLNVMTIELEGVAGEIASKGLGTLFKASYKLESSSRLVDKEAPRARWKLTDGKEFSEAEYTTKLIGKFGIAVSDSLKEIPDSIKSQNPEIKLETWNYGSVAEILHVGGYDKERPTVKKLTEFIEKNGYRISGLHEEEYLKGPGMFFKGNPDDYYTIIRYQVEKKK